MIAVSITGRHSLRRQAVACERGAASRAALEAQSSSGEPVIGSPLVSPIEPGNPNAAKASAKQPQILDLNSRGAEPHDAADLHLPAVAVRRRRMLASASPLRAAYVAERQEIVAPLMISMSRPSEIGSSMRLPVNWRRNRGS